MKIPSLRILLLAAVVLPACLNLDDTPPPADAGVTVARTGGSGGGGRSGRGGAEGASVDAPGGGQGGAGGGNESDPPTDPGCEPGFHKCNDVCVDGSKPETCGMACDPCPSVTGGTATCNAGKCGVSCPAGKKPCLEACIDENAACDGACPTGKNPCNGICVDAKTTTACGSSCTVCPTSPNGTTSCDGNQCTLTCKPGFHLCGDECRPDDDAMACGTSCSACPVPTGGEATCDGKCGVRCPTGTKICNGTCIATGQACDGTCPAGKHDCGGNCVDDTQTANCGTSCTPCSVPPNADATCGAAKTCGFKCRAGFHQCGDKCEPNNSPQTCGSSCSACPAPANGAALCTNEKCAIRCDNGFRVCGNTCVANDQPCNGACDGGRRLCGGACVPANTVTAEVCDGKDNDCNGTIDDNIAPQDCSNKCTKATRTCVAGRWDASRCPAGNVQCCNNGDCGSCQECNAAGTCVNQGAGQDKKNECSGAGCNAGRCRTCTPNQKMCSTPTNLRTCAADGSRWEDRMCFKCEGQTCSQCAPKTETCDGKDNDCDGDVDEGNPCPQGEHYSAACVNGQCLGKCDNGYRLCGGKCEAVGQFCGSGCTKCGANENCDGGTCKPKCTDQCKAGATRCEGNYVIACGRAANGCLEWRGGQEFFSPCKFGAQCMMVNGAAMCVGGNSPF